MDEECFSEDRVKIEIERLRRTVGHAVDLDQSSDDEALRVDSDDSDEEGDRNETTNEKQYNQSLQVAAGIFNGIARGSISQDSITSLSGIVPNISASPEVCLAMNRAYQQMIGFSLVNITTVLELNRQRQEEVKLEGQAVDKSLPGKKKTVSIYRKPYFKDINGSYPPANNDTLAKRHASMLDPFLKPSKAWSVGERNRLRDAVQSDRLKANLRPCMNKKELEHAKLKSAVPNSDEEKSIKERLDVINAQIKSIQSQTDIESVYGNLSDAEINSIDWLKIANVDFEGLRTAESCKQFWKNAGHPGITTSKWLPEEDTLLVELIIKYKGVCWEDVAKELGTNRTAFQCLQRYQTKLNPCLQTGKWTPEEDAFLQEVVTNLCDPSKWIPWSDVAYYIEGRSREQCAIRWAQLHPLDTNRGKWTREEDRKLSEAVLRFGSFDWWKIQEFVSTRSSYQCRERWKNTLDTKLNFGAWSYEEDKTLWLAVQELGEGKWSRIVDALPGRTDNMCLQRYRRLLKWHSGISDDMLESKWHSGSASADEFLPNAVRAQQKKIRLEKVLKQVEREARQRKVECALLTVDIGVGRSLIDDQITESLAEFSTQKLVVGDEAVDMVLGKKAKTEEEAWQNKELRRSLPSYGIGEFLYTALKYSAISYGKQVRRLKLRYRCNPSALQRHLDELDLIRHDRNNGIFIPRALHSEFSNPSFFGTASRQQKVKDTLQRHFSQCLSECANFRCITCWLENWLTRAQLYATHHQIQHFSGFLVYVIENVENVTAPQETNVQQTEESGRRKAGRKRLQLSYEEVEVEKNIITILQQRRHKVGRRKGTTLTSTSSSADKACVETDNCADEIRKRVMRMMTTALNFHRFFIVPPHSNTLPPHTSRASAQSDGIAGNSASESSQLCTDHFATVQKRTENGMLAKENNVIDRRSSEAVQLVSTSAAVPSSSSAHDEGSSTNSCKNTKDVPSTVRLSQGHSLPNLTGVRTSSEPSSESNGQNASTPSRPSCALDDKGRPVSQLARRAMQGEMARKMYTMPLLPPSCTTVGAFKRLLLDRLRLMTIAGKFQEDSLLCVPEVVKEELKKCVSEAVKAQENIIYQPNAKERQISEAGEKQTRGPGVLQKPEKRAALKAGKRAALKAAKSLKRVMLAPAGSSAEHLGNLTNTLGESQVSADSEVLSQFPIVRADASARFDIDNILENKSMNTERIQPSDRPTDALSLSGPPLEPLSYLPKENLPSSDVPYEKCTSSDHRDQPLSKRKRGRPRSTVDPILAGVSSECQSLKSKRGRPRKDINASVACASSKRPLVKSGRGRPRKHVIPCLADACVDGGTSSNTATAAAATAASFARAMANKSIPVEDNAIVTENEASVEHLMNTFRNTHDYQMLKARFLSLFLWPSLLSTVSVKECESPPTNEARNETVVRLINTKPADREIRTVDVQPGDTNYRYIKPCKYRKMKAAALRRAELRRDQQASAVFKTRRVRLANKGIAARRAIRLQYEARRQQRLAPVVQRRSTRLEYKRLLLGENRCTPSDGEEENERNSQCKKNDGDARVESVFDRRRGRRRYQGDSRGVDGENNDLAEDQNTAVDDTVDVKIPMSELIANYDSSTTMPPPAALPPSHLIAQSPSAAVQQPAGVLMVPLYSTVSADGSTSELTLGAGHSPLLVVPPDALQGLLHQMPWFAAGTRSSGVASGTGGASTIMPTGTVLDQSAIKPVPKADEPPLPGPSAVCDEPSRGNSLLSASGDLASETLDAGDSGCLDQVVLPNCR